MNEIKQCTEALLAAIQNSEEYREYRKQEAILAQNPELAARVRQFQITNFRLQNEGSREDLFSVMEQLAKESRELRKDPNVNAYLDAELAICRMIQKICKKLTTGIEIEIPEF